MDTGRSSGVRVADSESEGFLLSLFTDLESRGLHGVQMVISDDHEALQKAVTTSFIGARWQLWRVYFLRAILRKTPRKRQAEVIALVKSALNGNEDLLSRVTTRLE